MAGVVLSSIVCAVAPAQAFVTPVGGVGPSLKRKFLHQHTLALHRVKGSPAVTQRSPLSVFMMSNSQGYNSELAKQLSGSERGWLSQVAEGNLFPNKPRPAVAVTACRVLESGRTEYLLIQRGKAPNYGEWSLPGGSIELGEHTLAAAKRELLEETHLNHQKVAFFQESFMTSDAIVRDNDGRMLFHYVIAQMFAVISPDAEVRAGDDAMDVRWFSIQEIREQSFGKVTKDVLKVVERAAALQGAGLLVRDPP